ncbi:MAG: hypothetical protein AAF940_10695 [Pseudomonadota bacterium]
MKRLKLLAAAALMVGTAHAEPYCDALVTGDGLTAKQARSAPIYSDTQSGWIFTNDQFADRYDMKDSAAALVGDIIAEFDARGVPLAILVPPPRPVIAGQATLDVAMGGETYDVASAQASFTKLIESLNQLGAIAPDLQALALSEPALREAFYFKRDTHWTTVGAAHSAMALARLIAKDHPTLFPALPAFSAADLKVSGQIEEEGALADIARDACGADLAPETAPAFDLTSAEGGSLLGDAPARPRIALVGSSFSDRNRRDEYRVADALARALGADVDNYSVSGGGGVGGIESYVLSGDLDHGMHDLVIWELPYTEEFNSTSMLRQLLGALRHGASETASPLPSDDTIADESLMQLAALELDLAGESAHRVKLKMVFENGSKTTVSVTRRGALTAQAREKNVFVSLADLTGRTIKELKIEPSNGTQVLEVKAHQ